MAKQVMLGVRLDAETRAAFKAWCAARQVTAQAVLRDDVARHLATPAVPPIPRDRALVLVLRREEGQVGGRRLGTTAHRLTRLRIIAWLMSILSAPGMDHTNGSPQ